MPTEHQLPHSPDNHQSTVFMSLTILEIPYMQSYSCPSVPGLFHLA